MSGSIAHEKYRPQPTQLFNGNSIEVLSDHQNQQYFMTSRLLNRRQARCTMLDIRGAHNVIRMAEGTEWKTAFPTRVWVWNINILFICISPTDILFPCSRP